MRRFSGSWRAKHKLNILAEVFLYIEIVFVAVIFSKLGKLLTELLYQECRALGINRRRRNCAKINSLNICPVFHLYTERV